MKHSYWNHNDFCDKYMNWVILYVNFLDGEEKLWKELE